MLGAHWDVFLAVDKMRIDWFLYSFQTTSDIAELLLGDKWRFYLLIEQLKLHLYETYLGFLPWVEAPTQTWSLGSCLCHTVPLYHTPRAPTGRHLGCWSSRCTGHHLPQTQAGHPWKCRIIRINQVSKYAFIWQSHMTLNKNTLVRWLEKKHKNYIPKSIVPTCIYSTCIVIPYTLNYHLLNRQ